MTRQVEQVASRRRPWTAWDVALAIVLGAIGVAVFGLLLLGALAGIAWR